jgi:phage FluMu protein Com
MVSKKIVCPKCEGEGKVCHEALEVWTNEDIDNNPEEFETYLAGGYDVPCPRCKGLRVVEDTQEERESYAEQQQDHRTYLMESGMDIFG